MAEDIDFAHLPSGQLAWRTLVDQISKVDPTAERYFYEIKSNIDLNAKEARAKVAKFILGAANRDPARASSRFDGRALMFLGIGDGTAPGIIGFEALELQSYVRKFTGTPGPGWDFERIDVGNNRAVIVVIVDPPDAAQQPWVCQSDGLEKLCNGRIYLRGDGDTREARGEEAQAMLARRDVAAKAQVDLSVEVIGQARSYVWDEAVLKDWLDRKREWLLDALPKRKKNTLTPDLSAVWAGTAYYAGLGGSTTDKRSEEEYIAEIDAWAAEVRRELPKLLDEVAGYDWAPVVVRVRNMTDTYLDNPEFKLHIEGPVDALDKRSSLIDVLRELPSRPRRWGPVPNMQALFGQHNALSGLSFLPSNLPTIEPRYGIVRFENGGSTDLNFSLEELRPRAVHTTDDDDFVLILRREADAELHGTWQATVRGHHAVYEGELTVPVSPDVVDYSRWLQHCLEDDEDLKPVAKDPDNNKST